MKAAVLQRIYMQIESQYGAATVCIQSSAGEKYLEGTLESIDEDIAIFRTRDGVVEYIDISTITSLKRPIETIAEKHNPYEVDIETKNVQETGKAEAAALQQIDEVTIVLPATPSFEFNADECFAEIQSRINSCGNRNARRMYNSVLNALRNAIKTRTINDKLPGLRTKLISGWNSALFDSACLWDNRPDDYISWYYLFGAVTLCGNDFIHAIEPLTRAGKYRLAAWAADKAGERSLTEDLLFSCALSTEDPNVIGQGLADAAIRRTDVTPFAELLSIYKDDAEICNRVKQCLRYIGQAVGIQMEEQAGGSPYEKAISVFTCFPRQWSEQTSEQSFMGKWEEYKSYLVFEAPEEDKELHGTVTRFNTEQAWGFIDFRYYFWIGQVLDDREDGLILRQLLSLGRTNMQVSFFLGEGKKGIAATDIILSGEELAQAKHYLHENSIDYGQDPYSRYPFMSLPEIGYEGGRIQTAFTWALSTEHDSAAQMPENSKPVVYTEKPALIEKYTDQSQKSFAGINGILLKGRKALLKHDYKTAESCFLMYLKDGPFIDSVVGDMIRVYLEQPERMEQAVNVLNQYGSRLTQEKRLNISIQVYDKLKDYEQLCALYEEAIPLVGTALKKSHYIGALIRAYTMCQNYKMGLVWCDRWQTLYQQNQYGADFEKLKVAVPSINRRKAICLYYLGDIDAAKRIAADLIRLNPGDTAASQILDGTLGLPSAGKSEKQEDSIDVFWVSDSFTLVYDEYDEDESEMTPFVLNRIFDTDLSSSLKNHIDNGQYSAEYTEADRDIDRLISPRVKKTTSKDRSDRLFAVCKIIRQVQERAPSNWPRKRQLVPLTGSAMASWGDYMVGQCYQLDTPRMAYLYTIRVLRDNEYPWMHAYNRYLRSFFLGSNGLTDYIAEQTKLKSNQIAANNDFLLSINPRKEQMPPFLLGVLQLLDVLYSSRPLRYGQLVEDLFNMNPELRSLLCEQLNSFLCIDRPISEYKLNSFKQELDITLKKLKQSRERMQQQLFELKQSLENGRLNENMLERLNPVHWNEYLTDADSDYYQRLWGVLIRSQDFFSNSDFESRAACLRTVTEELQFLQRDVQKEPTDFAYGTLYPLIAFMNTWFAGIQNDLYQESVPSIVWEESDVGAHPTEDGDIHVELTVRNEITRQSAKSLILDTTLMKNDDVIFVRDVHPIEMLRGGDSREIVLTVRISESAREAGSFTLPLFYTYSYDSSAKNSTTYPGHAEITIVIKNDAFLEFFNPFERYAGGNPIQDPSSPMFYGREQEMTAIVDALLLSDGSMNYGHAITIYGQTRTGKSSLLCQSKEKIAERFGDHVVFWDLANISELLGNDAAGTNSFLPQFLYHLMTTGADAIEQNETLNSLAKQKSISLEVPDVLNKPEFAQVQFNVFMRNVDKLMTISNSIVILLVDEFTYLHEQIRSGKVSDDFMKFWKALLQNHKIYAIVVGQDDMPEFMDEYPNEFACMELMKVTYLEEAPAKRLMYEPLERENHCTGVFKPDALDELYRLSAGSAYLIMIICSDLVDYLNTRGARVVTRGIIEDFLSRKFFSENGRIETKYYEPQIEERGHKELNYENRMILSTIASVSRNGGRAKIDDVVSKSITKERAEELLQRLVNRNVLAVRGGCYSIRVKLLEEWLVRMRSREE